MVKIKADAIKNRLYITIIGTLNLDEAIEAKQNILKSIDLLSPGFNVINDISKFIRGDEQAGIILKELIVLLIQKKVNKVVWVVGTSKVGLIQFAKNTLPLDQYQISYVPTLEEAETILENDVAENKN